MTTNRTTNVLLAGILAVLTLGLVVMIAANQSDGSSYVAQQPSRAVPVAPVADTPSLTYTECKEASPLTRFQLCPSTWTGFPIETPKPIKVPEYEYKMPKVPSVACSIATKKEDVDGMLKYCN